jgi:flavin reductase (DIM6/NTAB) family NADH-FMN oxidoreductase RutF
MVDSETFRDAMRSWATGVSIISTQTAAIRHGMTLSTFNSLSLDPPLVLVCVQNNVRMMALLRESKKFAISVLRAGQEDISSRFAGRGTENTDRFSGLNTFTLITGSPILKNALAYFDCNIGSMYPGGTHTVIIGRVLAAKRFEGEPLVYWDRHYRKITTGEG